MTDNAPDKATKILVSEICNISIKLIIENPLKTKFNKIETGIAKPKTIGIKHIKKQIIFLDTIYETQESWTNGSDIEDINENLKKIVKDLGINSSQFDKCLIDEAISDKILNGRIKANKKYSINSTPTIIINEKKLEGSASFKNIKKRIEKII